MWKLEPNGKLANEGTNNERQPIVLLAFIMYMVIVVAIVWVLGGLVLYVCSLINEYSALLCTSISIGYWYWQEPIIFGIG